MYIHHTLGLACMPVGLYYHLYHLYGMVAITFMEGTTLFKNNVWLFRTMGLEQTKMNLYNGVLFVATFFLFRVVCCNGFLLLMLWSIYNLDTWPLWVYLGPTVYGGLCALNVHWFGKVRACAVAPCT